jgi:hypothetical protein
MAAHRGFLTAFLYAWLRAYGTRSASRGPGSLPRPLTPLITRCPPMFFGYVSGCSQCPNRAGSMGVFSPCQSGGWAFVAQAPVPALAGPSSKLSRFENGDACPVLSFPG